MVEGTLEQRRLRGGGNHGVEATVVQRRLQGEGDRKWRGPSGGEDSGAKATAGLRQRQCGSDRGAETTVGRRRLRKYDCGAEATAKGGDQVADGILEQRRQWDGSDCGRRLR